jgi:CheY-like chemotaxis protein
MGETLPAHGTSTASLQPRRGVIVYIEDSPSSVALIQDVVSDLEDTDLLVAPSAELGIELVRACAPWLVIMDIHLPGMNGFEATARLRTAPETRDIPVIALSAAAASGERVRVEAAGFYRYLTKPLDIAEFSLLLKRLQPPAASAS